jgi:hypothetical protein
VYWISLFAGSVRPSPAADEAVGLQVLEIARQPLGADADRPADQPSQGQKYLYLAVGDMTRGRLDTLQIPLNVATGAKQPKS